MRGSRGARWGHGRRAEESGRRWAPKRRAAASAGGRAAGESVGDPVEKDNVEREGEEKNRKKMEKMKKVILVI
jgi:hypothetical protein